MSRFQILDQTRTVWQARSSDGQSFGNSAPMSDIVANIGVNSFARHDKWLCSQRSQALKYGGRFQSSLNRATQLGQPVLVTGGGEKPYQPDFE